MANPLTQKKPGMGKSVWDRLRWRSHWYRKTGRTNMTVGSRDEMIRAAIQVTREAAEALMEAIEEAIMADDPGTGNDVDEARLAFQAAAAQLAEITARFGGESEGTGGLGDQGSAEEEAERSWSYSYAEQMKLLVQAEIDRQQDRAHSGSATEVAQAYALAQQNIAATRNSIAEANANTQAYIMRTLGDQTDFNARTISERGRSDRVQESSVDTAEKMGEDTTRDLSRNVPRQDVDQGAKAK